MDRLREDKYRVEGPEQHDDAGILTELASKED
jgi:hypothetical protein